MFRKMTIGMVYRSLCLLVVSAVVSSARANINLEFRPATQTASVGDTVNIGLYAVSDDPEMDQLLSAVDVIFSWDPAVLQLLGVDDTGGPGLTFSGFIADVHGINEVIPPQDGDGMYTGIKLAPPPVAATPQGTLITTFQFSALAETPSTVVDMLVSAGDPVGYTVVWDGTEPNLDVTGTLGSAEVTIVCQLCPGDATGNNVVDFDDLAVVLANYHTTSGATSADGDFDCDGDVVFDDLAILLANYLAICP